MSSVTHLPLRAAVIPADVEWDGCRSLCGQEIPTPLSLDRSSPSMQYTFHPTRLHMYTFVCVRATAGAAV